LWFAPREALTIDAGHARLTTYRFNRHVIEHRFCAVCGCQPFGLGTGPDGRPMAAINLRCLDELDLDAIPRVPFDGRSM
jgi:hypothetical protein